MYIVELFIGPLIDTKCSDDAYMLCCSGTRQTMHVTGGNMSCNTHRVQTAVIGQIIIACSCVYVHPETPACSQAFTDSAEKDGYEWLEWDVGRSLACS